MDCIKSALYFKGIYTNFALLQWMFKHVRFISAVYRLTVLYFNEPYTLGAVFQWDVH